MNASENQIHERLAVLEQTYRENAKTNWTMVLAAVMVVMALYGAAIRPLTNDVERIEAAADTLAKAVLEQNIVANRNFTNISIHIEKLTAMTTSIEKLEQRIDRLEQTDRSAK